MDEIKINIKNKAEKLLNAEVDYIEKFENVPNNSVYKISIKNETYIFKIYKQKT